MSVLESFSTCSVSRTGNHVEVSVHYCVLVQLRKLRIHPPLLAPSWKGFFIKIRDNIVIQSTNRYLDTPHSPSTTSRRLTRYVTWRLFCEVGGGGGGMFAGWFFWRNYILLGSQSLTTYEKQCSLSYYTVFMLPYNIIYKLYYR